MTRVRVTAPRSASRIYPDSSADPRESAEESAAEARGVSGDVELNTERLPTLRSTT